MIALFMRSLTNSAEVYAEEKDVLLRRKKQDEHSIIGTRNSIAETLHII